MSSSDPSTPNPRFQKQAKTAEDLLSTQTVGLVNLSDFRKRRAEAIEAKERDAHESAVNSASGRATPVAGDGASTPTDQQAISVSNNKKKKRKIGVAKLSFGNDEQNEDEGESSSVSVSTSTKGTPLSSRGGTPTESSGGISKKKITANTSVGFAPKALTKSALLREAQTRETLRKEFLQIQEQVKATEIDIPFVFYDGTNIPGGVSRVKKGDFIWLFLDKSRKVGADLGVGEKTNSRREWARIGVDDLMLVRGNIIIPHHYDFHYFIINKTLGPNNGRLFNYSNDPPPSSNTVDDSTTEPYNPLSKPSAKTAPSSSAPVEGSNDDPTFTKVVDRRWYERNKHIFPASVWQTFDPEKDYQSEVKRDQGGNTFFFS